MAKYNLIRIGTIYLTSDGLVGGTRCRTEVAGLDALKLNKVGAIALAADGMPYPFTAANLGQGLPLSIKIAVTSKSVFDSIVTAINAALTGNTTIQVTLSGDTGTFDLDCYPAFPNGVSFPGVFRNLYINDVQFNFVIKEIN